MIQGEAGCMKQLKLWMFLICFTLRFDSSEGKKCCVSVLGDSKFLGKRSYC